MPPSPGGSRALLQPAGLGCLLKKRLSRAMVPRGRSPRWGWRSLEWCWWLGGSSRGWCHPPSLAPHCSAPPVAVGASPLCARAAAFGPTTGSWLPPSLPLFFFQSRSATSTTAMAKRASWGQVSGGNEGYRGLLHPLELPPSWGSLLNPVPLPCSRTGGLQGRRWGPRVHLHLPQRPRCFPGVFRRARPLR